PNHRRALLASAELNERLGNTAIARQRYDALLANANVSSRTYRAYAGFLLRQSEKIQAAAILDRAAKAHPASADIQTLRAVVLQMLDRHSQCITVLQEFTASHTAPPETNWLLGKSWYALKNYSAALESFQRARLAGA